MQKDDISLKDLEETKERKLLIELATKCKISVSNKSNVS